MPDHPDDAELAARRARLEASLKTRSDARRQTGLKETTGFGQAMRIGSEFVAGVLVGAGLGYLIDRLAGTTPWGMIVFLLLGFAAGVLNVLRSQGMVAEHRALRPREPDDGRP